MDTPKCDKCGAKALTWWALIGDTGHDPELYYCGHHSDAHADAMVTRGWTQVADMWEGAVVI